jgi:hypothetical protein
MCHAESSPLRRCSNQVGSAAVNMKSERTSCLIEDLLYRLRSPAKRRAGPAPGSPRACSRSPIRSLGSSIPTDSAGRCPLRLGQYPTTTAGRHSPQKGGERRVGGLPTRKIKDPESPGHSHALSMAAHSCSPVPQKDDEPPCNARSTAKPQGERRPSCGPPLGPRIYAKLMNAERALRPNARRRSPCRPSRRW